jgi:cytochrome c556
MDHMKTIGKSTKALDQMMQGKTAYDAATVRAIAREVAAAGGDALTRLFPEGSIIAPSEARPEIWTDWARFTGLAEDMSAAAAGSG